MALPPTVERASVAARVEVAEAPHVAAPAQVRAAAPLREAAPAKLTVLKGSAPTPMQAVALLSARASAPALGMRAVAAEPPALA